MSNSNQDKKKEVNTSKSGGYQTPVEESVRKTGVAVNSDGRNAAESEAPENDSTQGSPNQGTESL